MSVYRRSEAASIEKNDVRMLVYNTAEQCPQASVVYQETERGHSEEFLHKRSFFIFYIIEGEGVWFIDGNPHEVHAGDVVIVPPNTRFYYKGKLRQVCVTSPAWEPQYEQHVRNVDL